MIDHTINDNNHCFETYNMSTYLCDINLDIPYQMRKCIERNRNRIYHQEKLSHKTKTIPEIILKRAKRDEMYDFNKDQTIFSVIMKTLGLFAIVEAKDTPETFQNYRCLQMFDFRVSYSDYEFQKWFGSLIDMIDNNINGILSICVADMEAVDNVLKLIPHLKYTLENSTLEVTFAEIKASLLY